MFRSCLAEHFNRDDSAVSNTEAPNPRASTKPSLVIVGGGFAGVGLARRLERLLPEWDLFLLDRDNHITYTPLLAEVVGAAILPGHVVAPLRQMVKRTKVWMAEVQRIDFERRLVYYKGEGKGSLAYDQLVLACGVAPNFGAASGMERYALPLKSLGDALYLRNRIMRRLEQATLAEGAERRRWLTTFIVAGGGFSGVEVAGAMADFLRRALRYYPEIPQDEVRLLLLHGRDYILPELSRRLGQLALRRMQQTGIEFRLSARVAEVDVHGVRLQSGERIDGGTVITTIGTAPTPLVEDLPLLKERGRIVTEADMSVPGRPGVWALGDCAAIPNAHDGTISPQTAQFAERQAATLAANVVARVHKAPTRAFAYHSPGQLASIGHNRAVANLYDLNFSGRVAWLLWRGVYLLKMPTLARKVMIFVEWNWEMLFPPDIACLRFNRSSRRRKKR